MINMKKTYAFTDVHGQYELWKQIRDYCEEDSTIYFLGDACDRGPHSIKIIKELLTDPRIIYLKGNHEEMLVEHVSEIMEGDMGNFHLWVANGGNETWEELMYEKESVIREIIRKLSKLPTHALYKSKEGRNIYLSHSGAYSPHPPQQKSKWKKLNQDELYVWDRSHLDQKKWWKNCENDYIVHGHSPVQIYFNCSLPIDYCETHKVNLDIASFSTYQIALLDLDTFECQIFEDEKEKDNEHDEKSV